MNSIEEILKDFEWKRSGSEFGYDNDEIHVDYDKVKAFIRSALQQQKQEYAVKIATHASNYEQKLLVQKAEFLKDIESCPPNYSVGVRDWKDNLKKKYIN